MPPTIMTTAAEVTAINQRIQRITMSLAQAYAFSTAITVGSLTLATYIASVVNSLMTQHSTKPALIMVNFFEGLVPASARLDSLAAFCLSQYNSYVSMGVANPDIGPYEALGVSFSNEPSFVAFTNGKTIQQIVTDTYNASLSTTPSAAQIQHFADQYTFYYNMYIGAGLSAAAASAQAKGAVIGQIMYYGGTTAGAPQNTKATAWLTSAGNGTESYSTPL